MYYYNINIKLLTIITVMKNIGLFFSKIKEMVKERGSGTTSN